MSTVPETPSHLTRVNAAVTQLRAALDTAPGGKSFKEAFAAINAHRQAAETALQAAFEAQSYLKARSRRNPSYTILLTKNTTSTARWRVTSFDHKEPIGHREYDHLTGFGPIQDAFAEFISCDMEQIP